MTLDFVQSSSEYLIIVPGIILSEHSNVADARRGQSDAAHEGFAEAVIFKRTPNGWAPIPNGKIKAA